MNGPAHCLAVLLHHPGKAGPRQQRGPAHHEVHDHTDHAPEHHITLAIRFQSREALSSIIRAGRVKPPSAESSVADRLHQWSDLVPKHPS